MTLDQATDRAKVIAKAALNMFHTMKLNISDMRGVSSNILKQDFLECFSYLRVDWRVVMVQFRGFICSFFSSTDVI